MSVGEDAHRLRFVATDMDPSLRWGDGYRRSDGQLSRNPIPMLARVWSASLDTTG